MKKHLLLILFLIPLLAQSQNIKGLYIGLSSQFQNTYIINDKQYDDVNYKHQFTTKWAPFGAVVGYKFNENHNVQVELIHSEQGETFDLVDVNGQKTGEKQIDLVYWNVPLLFKYTTPGTVRFTFQFGPQLSILQEGREVNRIDRAATYHRKGIEYTLGGNTVGTHVLASTAQEDLQQNANMGQFNKYDAGVLIGMGLEVSLTPSLNLSTNLRSHYNFFNIRQEEHIESAYDPDVYTLRNNLVVGVQVGLHYLFNTGDGTTPARHE